MPVSFRPSAIVDFPDEANAAPRRLTFGAPVRVLRADSLAEVIPVMDEAEGLARAGQWVVGFVAYEASPAFDDALATSAPGPLPLAWFAVYDVPRATHTSPAGAPADVDRSVAGSPGAKRSASIDALAPRSDVSDAEHARDVGRIRELIAAGDVYQVNLTIPFSASASFAPLALYERMRLSQGGRYSAFVDLGDLQVMSASPELFIERRGDILRSRPMKGTAPRGLYPVADRHAREALLRSEKDRAENVMIVDVVRNDVGRVARVGSVHVPSLCVAERFPTVWQLTSTVEGEVDRALPLSAIFRALFPPASVTGAPKIRATEIITVLEHAPRGIYCGAIGIIRPGGDSSFNVAIRTAWTADGGRTVRLNAGGGITLDSTASSELSELRAKIAAFTAPVVRPSLFETFRVEHGRPVRLERHVTRLGDSARYFDIPFDDGRASALVLERSLDFLGSPVARGRLVLEPGGALHASVEPFEDDPSGGARPISIGAGPIDRSDVRLYHKTTDRGPYESALASAPTSFDVLLWNADRQATEFTRGNLVAALGGVRATPPLDCGLLGGTLRAELLDRGEIVERIVTLNELSAATGLWFVNSLRGWVPVRVATR